MEEHKRKLEEQLADLRKLGATAMKDSNETITNVSKLAEQIEES